TMTNWMSERPDNPARRSTPFSDARRTTKPTIFFARLGSQDIRSAMERFPEWQRLESTRRAQWKISLIPWSRSSSMLMDEGARVRWHMLWTVLIHSQLAVANGARW